MKKPIYFIIFIFLTIITLSVIQVSVANSISTTGVVLAQYQDQIQAFQRQNSLLEQRYLEAAALTTIDQKAKKLGFVPDQTPLSLSSPLPLALK